MNESWNTQIHHVPYEWVMAHINEWSNVLFCSRACVSYQWVTSHHIWMSHDTYKYITCHMNASWLTQMNEAKWCSVPEPVCQMNEARHVIHEWVMAHMNTSHVISMSHGTHNWMKQNAVLFKSLCVIWMSLVTSRLNESRHVTFEWVMTHIN